MELDRATQNPAVFRVCLAGLTPPEVLVRFDMGLCERRKSLNQMKRNRQIMKYELLEIHMQARFLNARAESLTIATLHLIFSVLISRRTQSNAIEALQ